MSSTVTSSPAKHAWWPWCVFALAAAGVLLYYGNLNETALAHGDEALTAVRSYSLLNEGHFWTPHWNGTVNLHKPPFYYMLVALCFKVFGVGELAVRLPSVISFILLMAMTLVMVRRVFGVVSAVLCVALLACCPVLVVQSGLGMMDTLVLLMLMSGGYSLWRSRDRRTWLYAWGAACGIALLCKGGGAIFCLPVGLIYLAVSDRAAYRSVHLYAALGLAILLPGIWFASQYFMHHDELFNTYVAWEVGHRVKGHNLWDTFREQKTSRRLWHALGALAPVAVVGWLGLRPRQNGENAPRKREEARFFVVMAVVILVLTNLIKQQMYWYVLPVAVPLLVLAAGAIGPVLSGSPSRLLGSFVPALMLAGTFMNPAFAEGLASSWRWTARVLLALSAAAPWVPLRPARRVGNAVLLGLAVVVLCWPPFTFRNPDINIANLRESDEQRELAAAIPDSYPEGLPFVTDFKYFHMNTLLFYTHRLAIQWDDIPESAREARTLYGIFSKDRYNRMQDYQARVLMTRGKFELVQLDAKEVSEAN